MPSVSFISNNISRTLWIANSSWGATTRKPESITSLLYQGRRCIYTIRWSQLKYVIYLVLFFLLSLDVVAQNNVYFQKVNEGNNLLAAGKYNEAAKCYSDAFQVNGWRGYMPDRLNAARAWAMAGTPDSAYFNLFRIAERLDYGNLEELNTDKHFQPLRSDARWPILYDRVEKNSHSYSNKIEAGERLLSVGKYAEAAKCYSDAFQSNRWQGSIPDRMNAARAWAMAGTLDSAYYNLFKIAEQGDIDNFEEETAYKYFWEGLNKDKYFQPLRSDARWPILCDRANANLPSMPELAKTLEEVLKQDQYYRIKIDSISTQFGYNSAEMTNLRTLIQIQDSINLVNVTGFLEKYGWLGKKKVGWTGNKAMFLVVQHAPLPVQEKYLPIMREAVKTGDAEGADLALLEDRVLIRNGKKQIYGSQVTRDTVTNEVHFFPIEDVDNVDHRRAMVGLGTLADYARHFGIVWNAEAIEKNKKMAPRTPDKH